MALELVREMVWQGLAPDVISYSTAISACKKGEFGKSWYPM